MKRDWTERVHGALIGSTWIYREANTFRNILKAFFRPAPCRWVKTFLNGIWLEHPLHPLLTDVPVGAWTAAILLDLVALVFGVKGLGPAAAVVMALGLVGALGTLAAGLVDWLDVGPPDLSIGFAHGITNIAATILFAVSFVETWVNHWAILWRVFWPGLAGYVVLSIGAYLGGSLVFRRGLMINRNAFRSGPEDFLPVLPLQDLPENQPKSVDAKGTPVLLMRRGEQVYALGAVCSHYGAPLEEGQVKDGILECPWHHSRFRFEDGRIVAGPATSPLPFYETRIKDGYIEVKEK
jgi:nitrite reductase/ring-hydroxylating ferredoxin subunit/uncharacterized membrane protein